MRFHASGDGAGSSAFAAVNADRTVALKNTVPGSIAWGTTNFSPTNFHLGTVSSTHTVTLTTGIDLNGGVLTIHANNGTALVEGELSGVLSDGAFYVRCSICGAP